MSPPPSWRYARWNDDATAKYALESISGWHWHCVGGGMNAWGTRDFVHGYVMCDEAINGRVLHSCEHGPLPPHNIKICGLTIHKLIAAGIDAPERLLFMSPAEIGQLKGIDPALRKEVDAYRSRFCGGVQP